MQITFSRRYYRCIFMKFALCKISMAVPEVFATGLIISPRRVFSMRYNSMGKALRSHAL